jgi:hypothetical protein
MVLLKRTVVCFEDELAEFEEEQKLGPKVDNSPLLWSLFYEGSDLPLWFEREDLLPGPSVASYLLEDYVMDSDVDSSSLPLWFERKREDLLAAAALVPEEVDESALSEEALVPEEVDESALSEEALVPEEVDESALAEEALVPEEVDESALSEEALVPEEVDESALSEEALVPEEVDESALSEEALVPEEVDPLYDEIMAEIQSDSLLPPLVVIKDELERADACFIECASILIEEYQTEGLTVPKMSVLRAVYEAVNYIGAQKSFAKRLVSNKRVLTKSIDTLNVRRIF